MEENTNLIETLFQRLTQYGKASYDLLRLKSLDRISDIISSFIPNLIVFALIMILFIFFNLGLSLWLGEILGKTYFGFFAVSLFYGIIGLCVYFFLHKAIKKKVSNYIIKLALK